MAAGPLRSARLIVVGSALASALLLVLGLRFRLGLRSLVLGLLAIGLGGGVVGLLPGKQYREWATGEIHVTVEGDGQQRVRVYRMRTAVAGEPELVLGEQETPLLSDGGEAPWWEDADKRVSLHKGRWRFTLEETVRPLSPPRPVPVRAPLSAEAWPGQRLPFQGGGWAQWQMGERGRPANGPRGPILRIRAVRQD